MDDDMDAALAAQLQLEERRAASMQHDAFTTALMRDLQKALSCEDPAALAAARAAVPFERLRAEAAATVALNRELGAGLLHDEDDVFVQASLLWFKSDFFSWVGTSQPCAATPNCGGTAESQGALAPTREEAADGAGRVEAFVCARCGGVTRFPRYTDPKALLRARRGRCGEWAHAFLLLLRAAGLEARHAHDFADHVWVEYFSKSAPPLGRWVHVDPCEAAYDVPLLYESGWGKRVALVTSTGAEGAADVTRRYVSDYAGALARRGGGSSGAGSELAAATEAHVAAQITALNRRLRARLPRERRAALLARDLAEMMQLGLPQLAPRTGAAAALPARLSGPAEWRAARGEDGAAVRQQQQGQQQQQPSLPPAPPPGTRYDYAPRAHACLEPLHAALLGASNARVFGAPSAACRASGGNGAAQGPGRLFDGDAATKWLDFGGGGAGGQAWAEWRLPAAAKPRTITHYSLVSADDAPERDPAHIVLECVPAAAAATSGGNASGGGGGDGDDDAWTLLDEREGLRFSGRGQLLSFAVPAAARGVKSRRWRLRVLAARDPGAANSVQLSSWEAYSAPGDGGSSSGSGGTATVPFLTRAAIDALRSMGTAGAVQQQQQQQDGGNSNNGNGDDDAAAARVLLRRIASNLLLPGPPDAKYFRLHAAKLGPLLAQPHCVAALLAMGFRPLALASDGDGTRAALVADASDAEACRAGAAAVMAALSASDGSDGVASS